MQASLKLVPERNWCRNRSSRRAFLVTVLSGVAASLRLMGHRWTLDQVAGAAPDQMSLQAARKLSTPRSWSRTGCDDGAVWGDCQGSGKSPYQVLVDLGGPAYKCSCPSRKFPCKHTLALLLLWSDGTVADGPRTEAVEEWFASRRARARKAAEKAAEKDESRAAGAAEHGGDSADSVSARRADQRAARVADGMRELERWLLDQVREGLSKRARTGYAHWDSMAARLVDAQAPGAAAMVRRMGTLGAAGPDWPNRLLEAYGRAWLLTNGYARLDELGPELAATLRARVGITTPREQVLREVPPVRDRWLVLGSRDETDLDGLTTRRVWLHGTRTARRALVLSFAMNGQSLDASLIPGTEVDADLTFFPAAARLRALVARIHHVEPAGQPSAEPISAMLATHAEVVARDPWLDGWPVVVGPVIPTVSAGWHVVDDHDDALALVPGQHWRLLAVSGGRGVLIGGEWSSAGLLPLTVWTADRMVRL